MEHNVIMNNIKEILQIIANMFVVYGYHVENNGLVNGKAGIMLYLYRYAQYAENEHYQDYANDMLDGMMRIAPSLPFDFENGLAGVGWMVGRLLNDDLLEGEPDVVLPSIDKIVFNHMECNPAISLLGSSLYFVERFKHDSQSSYMVDCINKIFLFITKGIENYKGTFSLYHINSILYFLGMVCGQFVSHKNICRILQLITSLLKRIFDERVYDVTDVIIYHQVVDVLKRKMSDYVNLLDYLPMEDYLETKLEVSQFIRIACQQLLYFDKITIPFPSDYSIYNFVDDKQQNIQMSDFVINGGLAGLGLSLLEKMKCDEIEKTR